jgi:hypothetical protein
MAFNAFTLTHTFSRQDPDLVFSELKKSNLSGVNLALNYHASRDLLLRQGPRLEYLRDGFHYYKPNLNKYPDNSVKPNEKDHFQDSKLLESILSSAKKANMSVNAWLVFAHNSAIGIEDPNAVVTNALGNKFLSELCPANKKVQNYFIGMVTDIVSRGVHGIVAESLHFHGAQHGEHHERFFIELSPISEFLFALCFCNDCISNFASRGGNGEVLRSKVADYLELVFENEDQLLSTEITKESLQILLGDEILKYLESRESAISQVYEQISKITEPVGVKFTYVDQSPLIDMNSTVPLNDSWLLGIDNHLISKSVDSFLPLIYRKSQPEIEAVARHYVDEIAIEVDAILRPTYPDCKSGSDLIERVKKLNSLGIVGIDFYLLDTWRDRDLQRVAVSLDRIARPGR